MVLIPKGEGELETRQGIQRIPAGSVFLLRPGEWHRHRPLRQSGWTNLWITFSGGLPREWMRRNVFHLQGSIASIGDYDLFLHQFEHLLWEIHNSPAENTAKLSCQLIGLLSHMLNEGSGGEVNDLHEDQLVARTLSFIWGNPFQSVTVSHVARHLGCGRRLLERHFKDGTGRSVLEEIQACRIDRSKRLLADTNIPLRECSIRAGFKSSEHMRQVFRKQFGITSQTYRNLTRER